MGGDANGLLSLSLNPFHWAEWVDSPTLFGVIPIRYEGCVLSPFDKSDFVETLDLWSELRVSGAG